MVKTVSNWIDGEAREGAKGWVDKYNPATGEVASQLARSDASDVNLAVKTAKQAQVGWAEMTPVARGAVLFKVANAMEKHAEEIAAIVANETGKSPKEALGETQGAIALARFFAAEGQRMFGRTTTSGNPNRSAMIFRQPIGVAGLIAAANTPIANISWKTFPALICGNGVVFKASEDAPMSAWILGQIAHEAGLPKGILNIIQGLGQEAGQPLAEHPDVGVVSFTGSTAVGIKLAEICARQLKKCSMELGGKNPFVILDDADIDKAVHWASLSAFSNAGQRCASGSRIIVTEGIYDRFKEAFVAKAKSLKVGPTDSDDYGPVINERQLTHMIAAVERAVEEGAILVTGGKRVDKPGYFMAPTIMENVAPDAAFSCNEVFGPIAALYRVKDYKEALALANNSDYGLTGCIHTRDMDRGWHFAQHAQVGVASINGATFGSEPHMPFGGRGLSGNGTREPGPEALDIYSQLKNVLVQVETDRL